MYNIHEIFDKIDKTKGIKQLYFSLSQNNENRICKSFN